MIDSFRFEDSYRIFELCELVFFNVAMASGYSQGANQEVNYKFQSRGHLKLGIVEGSANCEVSLQSHCHYEVDAGAQGNPGNAFDQNPLGGNLKMDTVSI